MANSLRLALIVPPLLAALLLSQKWGSDSWRLVRLSWAIVLGLVAALTIANALGVEPGTRSAFWLDNIGLLLVLVTFVAQLANVVLCSMLALRLPSAGSIALLCSAIFFGSACALYLTGAAAGGGMIG